MREDGRKQRCLILRLNLNFPGTKRSLNPILSGRGSAVDPLYHYHYHYYNHYYYYYCDHHHAGDRDDGLLSLHDDRGRGGLAGVCQGRVPPRADRGPLF